MPVGKGLQKFYTIKKKEKRKSAEIFVCAGRKKQCNQKILSRLKKIPSNNDDVLIFLNPMDENSTRKQQGNRCQSTFRIRSGINSTIPVLKAGLVFKWAIPEVFRIFAVRKPKE